ncbi:hypothetical protein R6G69_00230 [Actinotignum urinale]|uniref:hypothetical protein n=1 Tax=Actinotignum urinale TaxID=190146 RepID=UPI002A7EAEF6|nr:hypothetical protein [Actinotignum urinale]MDY5128428.1 hypothetical protein [Actinotignum urinale]
MNDASLVAPCCGVMCGIVCCERFVALRSFFVFSFFFDDGFLARFFILLFFGGFGARYVVVNYVFSAR